MKYNYKKYTLLESLKLMKKGKKMCMSEGLDHDTGYYFVIESIYLIQHNGDGSVYNKTTGVSLGWIDNKRKWVIKKNYDGLNHHITLEEIERKELLKRQNYVSKDEKKIGFYDFMIRWGWIYIIVTLGIIGLVLYFKWW